jgi:hypothetical protein
MKSPLLLLILPLFCVGLLVAAPLFNSRIEIPKHEELIIRQADDESFRISINNIGKVDVHLLMLKPGEHEHMLQHLKPDQETTVKVHDLGALIIRNKSGKKAELALQGEGNPENYDLLYQKPDGTQEPTSTEAGKD